ncbi:MAG: hypothetical protein M3460_16220 [Actinomycetota bacterium]|nr:hypothetical protein [Actinomycetota bacterium]
MILLLATGFLAATGFELVQPPSPAPDPGGQGEDFGKAAPVGLVVLLLLFLAAALLVRSMNKHLRRVPKSFDDDSGTPPRE